MDARSCDWFVGSKERRGNADVISHMSKLQSPRTLSRPAASMLVSCEQNATELHVRELRTDNDTVGPLVSLSPLVCFAASSLIRSTLPELTPIARRSSRVASGDHAKH